MLLQRDTTLHKLNDSANPIFVGIFI
jgi:hypothetical protein